MKSSSEVFDAINSLERSFPVRAWSSGDIDLWPTYRFRLYGHALDALMNNEPKGSILKTREISGRLFRALFRVPPAALRDWRHNATVRPGTAAVFLSDGVSFVALGDAWYDRVIDPVIQALAEQGHHSLKLTPLSEVHIPRYVSSRFIQLTVDRIKLSATYRHTEVDLPQFEEFYKRACELFGGIAPSSSWLRVQAARLHALTNWFALVLERCGATHAFVNTYYSLEGLAFVQAARRRGLRSVDLQHGIQGAHHVAYARWASPPARGYSTLPDEFWVWGVEEASTINAWRSACATHVPRITGNFWLERWRDESDPLVAQFLHQARLLRGPKPQVLACVISDVPEAETEKVIEAAKLCGQSIAWWWRLHPVIARHSGAFARRLERHGLDGSQVRAATDLPLFALLRNADLTLAHSSTVIREAAELGVPSVVTSDYGAEVHRSLVQRGLVLHASEERAIAAAIQALASRKRAACQTASVDHNRPSLRAQVNAMFAANPTAARVRDVRL